MTSPGADRRRHPRHAVNLAATLVGEDGLGRQPVTIRNLSSGGAMLELPADEPLPGALYLLVPRHHLQPCELAWQQGTAAGVRYLE